METRSPRIIPSWQRSVSKLGKVGIDAMCFIYHFEAHPIFGPLIFSLFSLLEEGKIYGFTSVLTLAEILSLPKLQKDHSAWEEERQRFWQTPNLTVEPVDGKICEAAALLRVKYLLSLPDAIQVTTAIFNQADGFITNDERLRRVRELKVIILKDHLSR